MPTKYFCLPGKHYSYGELEWWAQGGMCHFFDHSDDCPPHQRVVSVSPSTMRERAAAIGACIGDERFADQRQSLTNAVNNMERCAWEAEYQGDPTDDKVSAYKLRHRSQHWAQVGAAQPVGAAGVTVCNQLPAAPSPSAQAGRAVRRVARRAQELQRQVRERRG